jgi:hypothetical protein
MPTGCPKLSKPIASVSALGARCMYLSVIVSVLWPGTTRQGKANAQAPVGPEPVGTHLPVLAGGQPLRAPRIPLGRI